MTLRFCFASNHFPSHRIPDVKDVVKLLPSDLTRGWSQTDVK
jgi:hypothetical protein